MKKLLLFSLLCVLTGVSAHAAIVGTDSFSYADGPLTGNNGGFGWDFHFPTGLQGTSPTSWVDAGGTVNIVGGVLTLQSTGYAGVRHEFGSDTWGDAAIQNSGIVYFAVTLTVTEAQGWLGISAMDGATERLKFGMPWTGGGLGFFGINKEDGGVMRLSTVMATLGQPYRIVGVFDRTNNAARMWIDPDSGDYDTALGTTADVVFNSTGMTNWINGVRLASGAGTTWDDLIVSTTFAETFVPGIFSTQSHDPNPAVGAVNVQVDSALSWAVPRDPNNLAAVDPKLASMNLYLSAPGDPNLLLVSTITSWDSGTLRATYNTPPLSPRSYDVTYRWRVDSILNDATVIPGDVWTFGSEKSVPDIQENPSYQVVDALAPASFTVTVSSISPPTYQWYKYVDGTSDTQLSDGGDISGAQTPTLGIANVELADEGAYYCEVNNSSGTPVTSEKAVLGVKRKIAFWDFESSDPNSKVAGSPVTFVHGTPAFAAGVIGNAMTFASGTQDMLYTDPSNVAYFDICNYTATVACWVKSTSTVDWVPLVARNGEDAQGWQFRQRDGSSNRLCFTTRGTKGGSEDGSASDRTVYDENWHYAVATYDGSVKKVYIDGVLSVTDTVTGLMTPTLSPVAIGGRVKGAAGSLVFDVTTACTLDDVSIYNYALDADTIAHTYADITQTNVCPVALAYDLSGDCRVDLVDFVLLAGQWLLDNTVYPN